MKLQTRFFTSIALAGVLVMAGWVQPDTETKEKTAAKPNIIFVLVDDLGYGDVGFNGQKHIKTPNLDKLAAEGKIFTNSYAGSTVCGPSRAALLLGKHTGHLPIRSNSAWTKSGKAGNFALADVTVAEELKRANYTTAVIGKWGYGQDGKTSFPLKQGFDYFYGFADHGAAHHYYPDKIWDNDKEVNIAANTPFGQNRGLYIHDEFTRKAKDFIRNNSKKPFFLYLNWTIPHLELTVPEDSKQPYKNLGWPEKKMTSKPGGYQNDAEGNVTFAGMISRMDRDMGEIMQLLKQLNIDENTLVVFTSDNGPEYAINNGNYFSSNGPLKGFKRDLYEGGIRTPFAVRWPAKIKAGTKTDHPIAFWDFLPTVCELVGIQPADKNIDGVSYLPILLGNTAQQKKPGFFYWEFNEKAGPIQAIRKGNWKAVKFYEKPMELYDLSKDVGEKNNVASANPKVVQEMMQILATARTENPEFPLLPIERTNKKQAKQQ